MSMWGPEEELSVKVTHIHMRDGYIMWKFPQRNRIESHLTSSSVRELMAAWTKWLYMVKSLIDMAYGF